MSDGKVMQKYYPPDFDPEKLRANRHILRAAEQQKYGRRRGRRMMEVRMMFPFTLCCDNCKEFVYVGTKFNSKVEKIKGEMYLNEIPIWRFYGRCPHCRNEIRFKTDPKNTDYVLESGGVRSCDPNKDAVLAQSVLEASRQQEAAEDAVKALEYKSYSAAEELRTLEALDELRQLNKRLLGSPEAVVERVLRALKPSKSDESPADRNDLSSNDEAEMAAARRRFDEQAERADSLVDNVKLDTDKPRGISPITKKPAVSALFRQFDNQKSKRRKIDSNGQHDSVDDLLEVFKPDS